MDKRYTAFISYSWDGHSHEQWIRSLVNDLRSQGGVDATCDQFEVQDKTVNLNTMMIKAIRDNDYVIVVLTKSYAQKSDSLQGGVGFETVLSLPALRTDPDKFIFVMREGDYSDVFPYHLRDYYAINFSQDTEYKSKLDELIRRIYKKGKFEKAPLGDIPDFGVRDQINSQLQAVEALKIKSVFDDLELPIARGVSDLDKKKFINQSFIDICDLFGQLFNQMSKKLSGFEFSNDKIDNQKEVFFLYLNGTQVSGVKIWIGGLGHGSSSICLSYGNHISTRSDSSMNEIINIHVDQNNQLSLEMTLSFMTKDKAVTPEQIVRAIWSSSLAQSFKS
ncbi:toll/interleukin-1 receptor domain-containing protein [Paenibacillus sp. NPDC057934]|uniref:toll/interleukin-1 receptor domain-containing protein n=1 Tax=Paenibacillus sp. NPDC057934 TaxID=3346282 RepID=UPI0036DB0937